MTIPEGEQGIQAPGAAEELRVIGSAPPLIQAAATSTATLLLVDDEPNILTSLRRLFRGLPYRILTANSGAEGLNLLEAETVDLVISDMRMPEMSGAQFLQHVRQRWPDTVRLLLTGYSDVESTVEAINKGEIYRYISKPWDDKDVVLLVAQALEMKFLQREKIRLEHLTQAQNAELQELNASLEDKVRARTEELEQAMAFLEQAHDKLKRGFITSVKVFTNLIELREGAIAGHSRRVADTARAIALQLKCPDNEVQEIFLASLLHDIGKIALPDSVLKKPFLAMSTEERELYIKHPLKGQTALMALEQLATPGKYVRHHHERFDGLGFPDHLAGLAIPLGARVLAIANDFDSLQIGTLQTKKCSRDEAIVLIKQGSGKRYDPAVVEAFMVVVGPIQKQAGGLELEINSAQLQPGMALSRDLVTRDGVLLLARDYLVDARIIEQIRQFESADGRSLPIHIQAKR